MFDQLSERLQGVFSRWGNGNQLSEDNMEEGLREIRRALLEADVSLRVIKAFLSRIKDRAIGENILKSLEPGDQLVKIVHDEMVALLGGENKPIFEGRTQPLEEGKPDILVLFGLQGSGKTTTAGKLALRLKKEGRKPMMIAADVYRPAAIQQLIILGKEVGVPTFTIEGSTDVLAIVHGGMAKAKEDGCDVVLVDTAGRLQIDTGMMAELLLVERTLQPHEKLLVVDAMAGQEAVSVAEAFNAQMSVTGLVLTKLDGDARGGAALSIVESIGKPIKFLGVSEKLSGLDAFHPDRMATRILGMGDVLSLVEKAQQAFDFDEAQKMEAKMRKQEFTLDDFLKLQGQLKMLGSLDQILGMLPIPGLTKDMREMVSSMGEGQMKKIETIIHSLNREERKHVNLLLQGAGASNRIKRISKGCGLPEQDITQFLRQFEQMRMMMTQFTKMMGGGGDDSDDTSESSSANRSGSMGLSMRRSTRKKNKSDDDAMNSAQLAKLQAMMGKSGMGGKGLSGKSMSKGGKGKFPNMPNIPGMPKMPGMGGSSWPFPPNKP